MAPKVHRVSANEIETGTIVEKSEHPWLTTSQARHIAKDNIKNNPQSYSSENDDERGDRSGRTVVVLNQNVKAVAPHKRKKKPMPPQQQTQGWWNYGQELL